MLQNILVSIFWTHYICLTVIIMVIVNIVSHVSWR